MADMMDEWYILVGRTPIKVGLIAWAKWRATHRDPHIENGDTWIDGKIRISTVFLGFNHSFFDRDDADPILFETMIFGGPLGDMQIRYRTYAEAERGHIETVTETRIAAAQIKAIAAATGVT